MWYKLPESFDIKCIHATKQEEDDADDGPEEKKLAGNVVDDVTEAELFGDETDDVTEESVPGSEVSAFKIWEKLKYIS